LRPLYLAVNGYGRTRLLVSVGRCRGDQLNFTLELRRLQGFALLLSCMPSDGKCRELFELALALDNKPILDRLVPPEDLAAPHGFQAWLESIWAREDLSPEEHEVIWWQNSPENLEVAIGELRAIEDRLDGKWILS
jgi:hypothetical protein